jgi:hypothetical protein
MYICTMKTDKANELHGTINGLVEAMRIVQEQMSNPCDKMTSAVIFAKLKDLKNEYEKKYEEVVNG